MDFKIIWTEPSIANLKEIVEYIALDNSDAAYKQGKDILNSVKVLGTFPFIGPPYPRRSKGNIREIICGKYRIFYEVFPDRKCVEIHHVWHGARKDPIIRP